MKKICQLEENTEDRVNRNYRDTLVIRGIKKGNQEKTWNNSARGVIKIRRTANERALSIKNDNDLKSLYPEFLYRDR